VANRFWIGTTSADSSLSANYAATSGGTGGASVPTSSDTLTFDSAGNNNCTLTENLSCLSLSINTTGGYTGQFDAVTFDLAIGTGGVDFTTSQANDILMGSGTWTCAGDWITSPMGGSKFQAESANLAMTGTGKNLTVNMQSDRNPNTVSIGASATITTVGGVINNFSVVSGGSFTINTGTFYTGGDSTVGTSCTVDGTGTWLIKNSANITSIGSAIAVDVTFQRANDIAAGTYSGAVKLSATAQNNSMTFLGDVTFSGAVTVGQTGGTLTFANNVNNPSITIGAGFDLSGAGGAVTWTKGSGAILVNGTGDQTIDFAAKTIEDITFNKIGGVLVLGDGFTTDSFTGTSTGTGTFDPNERSITSTGACVMASGFIIGTDSDTMNGSTWVFGDGWSIDSQLFAANGTWTVDLTGTDTVAGSGAVQACDASAGETIDASGADAWIDNGFNTNWLFPEASGGLTEGGPDPQLLVPIDF
jgi:hypothetical protein